MQHKSKSWSALVAACLLFVSGASWGVIVNTTVPENSNLYFADWGHAYDNPAMFPGSEFNALGQGFAPAAVAYTFSANQALSIGATGCMKYGPAYPCIGPNGNNGWIFRGNPVYSLIGIWSSDDDSIVPTSSVFFIGSGTALSAPNVAGNLYLFLAFNDGNYVDNTSGTFFSVTLDITERPVDPEPPEVPEPPAVALLGIALLALTVRRLKRG